MLLSLSKQQLRQWDGVFLTPSTAIWLFPEIKQCCFIFTLQEMDGVFSGRDNNETQPLKFLASSVATGAWKSRVTSQMPAVTGTQGSVEGAGRTTAVQHGSRKQAGRLRYTTSEALNLFATALHLDALPTSRARVWKRWGNLSPLGGEGGSTGQRRPAGSQVWLCSLPPTASTTLGRRKRRPPRVRANLAVEITPSPDVVPHFFNI